MGTEQAAELQTLLTEFASLDTPHRERRLYPLTEHLKSIATIEAEQAVAGGQPSNQWLMKAIESTLATPVSIDLDGVRKMTKPWVGGYTIVVIDQVGHLVGAQSTPHGRVYEEYGDNLYPPALRKALMRMHLELSARKGGLEKRENFQYIASLGFQANENLFLGDSMFYSRRGRCYIGASGCELTEDYIKGLFPPRMREHLHQWLSVDTYAGRGDAFFATLLSAYIEFPLPSPAEITAVEEDSFFAETRVSH